MMQTMATSTARDSRGFSFVELMVVVVVMATLLGVVITSAGDMTEEGRKTATLASMQAIRDAIVGGGANLTSGKSFLRDVGRLPSNTCTPPTPPAPGDLRWSLAELIEKGPEPGMTTYDPVTRRGWRGPYVSSTRATFGALALDATWAAYGTAQDWAVLDGWGNPIVLQIPDFEPGIDTLEERRFVRLVSAGGDGRIDTPRTGATVTSAQYPRVSLPGNLCGDDQVLYLLVADLRQ